MSITSPPANALAIGGELPPFELALTSTMVVAGAIASRDFMPAHHDPAFAKAQGAPDIFMNILTTNGYVSRYVTDWAGPEAIVKRIAIRLGAPAIPGKTLSFSGRVASRGLYAVENESTREHPFPQGADRLTAEVNALLPLRDGTFLVNTGETPLQFDPRTGDFRAVSNGPRGQRLRPLGLLPDGSVCLLSSGADSADGARLELFDGKQFQPAPWSLPETVRPERLAGLFASRKGELWLSSQEGVARHHDRKWPWFAAAGNSTPEAAHSFIELPDGKIWCATAERIWEFYGRDWLIVRGGFDRINALARSRDGSVWVASNSGLHRYYQTAWIDRILWYPLASENIRPVAKKSGKREKAIPDY